MQRWVSAPAEEKRATCKGVQRQARPDYGPAPVSATGSSGRSAQPATAHKAMVRNKGARMSIGTQNNVGNMEQARGKRHRGARVRSCMGVGLADMAPGLHKTLMPARMCGALSNS